MSFDVFVEDRVVIVRTWGIVDSNERKQMLQRIAEAYDEARADAVLVDYREAQIDTSATGARKMGHTIGSVFAERQPCFIAALANHHNLKNLRMVGASIAGIIATNADSTINLYVDESLAFDELRNWRDRRISNGEDVDWAV